MKTLLRKLQLHPNGSHPKQTFRFGSRRRWKICSAPKCAKLVNLIAFASASALTALPNHDGRDELDVSISIYFIGKWIFWWISIYQWLVGLDVRLHFRLQHLCQHKPIVKRWLYFQLDYSEENAKMRNIYGAHSVRVNFEKARIWCANFSVYS